MRIIFVIPSIYESVQEAKERIEHLTPYQLLRRDLKMVQTEKVKKEGEGLVRGYIYHGGRGYWTVNFTGIQSF